MQKLDVINRALLKTGLPLADNLRDCEWDALAVYESVSEELLRSFPWNFARRFATLAMAATPPPFGYAFSYAKPGDCLRIVDVRSKGDIRAPAARFEDAGSVIYTNASPCNARYIYRELEPDKWAPDFTDAVAARIACEIAAKAAQRMDLVPQLLQLSQLLLAQAKENDAREYQTRIPADNWFTDARNQR